VTRLSPIDAAFFLLETEQRPMNIGSLITLVPPKSARGRFADRLMKAMLECPVGPPFNRVLQPGLLPALRESTSIDARRQLHRRRLHAPGTLATLFEEICEIHVRRLPRDGPLWEAYVFEGLENGRVALYFKTHHGLIDGIGFIRVVTDTVTESPDPGDPRAIWEGLRTASAIAGQDQRPAAADAVGGTALDVGEAAGDLLRLALRQGLRTLGAGAGLALPFVGTPDVLKAPPSPNRVMGHCRLPLERARSVARARGGTVNDVVLTVLDLALSRYLEEIGTPPQRPLVADMPVALDDDGGAGNRITILQVPLGRPAGSPVERFQDVIRETKELKGEVRSLSGSALMLYSILVHSAASSIESLGLGALPMLANTVISNPAGIEQRVYFNGAEVELALPVSVVAHHQVLNITATTYVDGLHITFIALAEAVPDVQKVADYTVEAFAELDSSLRVPKRRKTAGGPRSRKRAAPRTGKRAGSRGAGRGPTGVS
jgi:WS/DGAT/MGAT family acyltransferase